MFKPTVAALVVGLFLVRPAFGQEITPTDLVAEWIVPGEEAARLPNVEVPWTDRNLRAEQSWSVTDLVAEDRCSAPLRATIFTEVYKKQTASQRSASVKFVWCRIDAGSESEAKKQNLEMSVVYDSLSIDGTTRDAFEKARQWRRSYCGQKDQDNYLQASVSEFSQVINKEVALRALNVYETCIQATAKGLHCRALRHTASTVGLYVSYISDATGPGGIIQAPRVVGSSAENAHQPGKPSDRSVFKSNKVVPPGGIAATMVQEDLTKDVVFTLNLTEGFPSCRGSLVVPASPSYVVQAHVESVQGSRTLTDTFRGSNWTPHANCHQSTPVPVGVQVCPGRDFVLDKNRFDWNAAQNPGNPPGHTKHVCFGAVGGYIQGDGPNGCVNVVVTILECNQGQAPAACAWSWKDGSNGGSTALASFVGTKNELLQVGPFDRTWAEIAGGTQLTLETPGLPLEITPLAPRWNVSITNKVTSKTVFLSQPGRQIDGEFSATYDFPSRALKIFVPQKGP